MTMIVYLFDARTLEFIGEYEAQQSPLDPTNFITPENSTKLPPPDTTDGQVAVFRDGAWKVEEDHRGEAYWLPDGSQHAMGEIGPLPENAVTKRPIGALEKWQDIKAERDRRTENGGYKVGTKWFHSDQKSRSQQQDNEAEGSALLPVQWKTMDGSFVTMTAELAVQIRAARMASDRAIFAVAEAHRSAMEACARFDAYDFSADWPKAFGEE